MNNIEIKNNKIILISHEMTYTGAPRSLLNICIILKKIGKNITVYTLENGPFQNEFERVGIEVNKYSDNCLGNISYSDIVILNTIFILISDPRDDYSFLPGQEYTYLLEKQKIFQH